MSSTSNFDFNPQIDHLIEEIINFQLGDINDAENSKDFENIFSKTFKKKHIKDLYSKFNESLKYNRIDQFGFSERIVVRWAKVIDQLEILIDFSMYTIFQSREDIDEINVKNHVLIRLHAKMILISKEITLLIKNGYGEGANARWRSLYETVVVATFLCTQDEDTSVRYFLHKDILNLKEARKYKDSYKKLKHKGYGYENLKKLEKVNNELVEKYGKGYKGDYGWIPDKVTMNKNFSQLEKIVDMEHFNPYFKFSSRGIHSSIKSFDNIGDGDKDMILVGPSNIGLVDPIQNTAIFLMKGTSTILYTFFNELDENKVKDRIVVMYFIRLLTEFEKDIGKNAIKIERQLYEEEYGE